MVPCQQWQGPKFWYLWVLLACCCCTSTTGVVCDKDFALFVENSANCADRPVPSLLYARADHESRLPTFTVEAKWLSRQPRRADDITVCTNSNFERLHMLEAQCESWGGPVSASIYLPLEYFNHSNSLHVKEAVRELDQLHKRIEESGACTLDMVLVSELVQPANAWAYPYNSLRNQAIARTRTLLLVLLDVDFLLSQGLRKQLLQPTSWGPLVQNAYTHKDVVVLPAFETRPGLPIQQGMEIAYRACRGSKRDVQALFQEQDLVRFAPFYKRGHAATDYPRWFNSSLPYPVDFEPGYEPFVLMSRVHVPWYDERFRGYGWDKITQFYQMVQQGYNLVVHPTGFVVHRPHPPSAGYNMTFTGPAYSQGHRPTENMAALNRIARDMMRDVRKGQYPPFGVTALAGCRRLDVFKQGVALPEWAAEAARSGTRLTTKQQEALKLIDPVVAWW